METDLESSSVQVLADQVLAEIRTVLGSVADDEIQLLADAILGADRIVVHGAGRMGIMSSAFAMRLAQLGFQCHVLNAPTTLAVGARSLLLLASGSGETQTVYDVAILGKRAGAKIALITARRGSRMGRLADLTVEFSVPTKLDTSTGAGTIQPMTTVADQSLLVLLDVLVLILMNATSQTSDDLWRRHRNLE